MVRNNDSFYVLEMSGRCASVTTIEDLKYTMESFIRSEREKSRELEVWCRSIRDRLDRLENTVQELIQKQKNKNESLPK